jgi:hypothetical protein
MAWISLHQENGRAMSRLSCPISWPRRTSADRRFPARPGFSENGGIVRFPRVLLIGGVVAASGLMAVMGGQVTPAGAAPNADALYKEAISSTKSWSVHYVSTGTVTKTTILESGDAGPASGTQEVLFHSGSTSSNALLIVIGGITFMKGNAQALMDLTGLTATEASAGAGKWIQFATDNKVFAQIVVGIRSGDVAQELELKGPYTLGHATRLNGDRVDAITGLQKIQGEKPVPAILYVQAGGRHLPVEEDTVNAQGKPSGQDHTVYSKWGETVRPQAPLASFTIGPVGST